MSVRVVVFGQGLKQLVEEQVQKVALLIHLACLFTNGVGGAQARVLYPQTRRFLLWGLLLHPLGPLERPKPAPGLISIYRMAVT